MSSPSTGGPLVLVSGLGPVTPLGFGLEDYVDSIAASAVTYSAAHRLAHGGPTIPDFDLGEFLVCDAEYPDLRTRCALAAGALAMSNALIEPDEVDVARCGLALGSALGEPQTVSPRVHCAGAPQVAVSAEIEPPGPWGSLPEVLAWELLLDGVRWNTCGDTLAGARALEAAWRAVRKGDADVMLAGGIDVAEADQMHALLSEHVDAPAPAQGAGFVVLETHRSLERREGYAFCELGSAVTRRAARGDREDLEAALRSAVTEAVELAGIWEGDVGLVLVSSGGGRYPAGMVAQKQALAAYSQVPRVDVADFVGDTLGADFPLQCVLAAYALSAGWMPPRLETVSKASGIELWSTRQDRGMMGFAALVVGCTSEVAAAAVLKAL